MSTGKAKKAFRFVVSNGRVLLRGPFTRVSHQKVVTGESSDRPHSRAPENMISRDQVMT
jgi:hypothetical protein